MRIKKDFSMQDQIDFASLSGDYNPIHVSEKKSIKTHAGQPIVHGVHLVLWALDALKIEFDKSTILEIKFISQVNLNTEVEAIFDKKNNKIFLQGNNKIKHCSIRFNNLVISKNKFLTNKRVKFDVRNIKPDNLEIDDVKLGQKINKLYGGASKHLAKNLFPYLVKNYGLNLVYEIACISSIVGMKVPGNHSLFLSLKLNFDSDNQNKFILIKNKHKILKLLFIDYYGKNLNAEIQALFRPRPTKVSKISSLKEEFPQNISLINKKVLVIGGSRGLGAYVTKLCSIMGASVTFTYSTQDNEAKQIEREIIDNGGIAQSKKLNILNDRDLKDIEGCYDYVYYFATPKILPNLSKEVNKKMLAYYNKFYVDSFEKLAKKYSSFNKKTKFLYPSTSYIDENKEGYKEYISAKLKGESICKFYNKKLEGNFFYPRIPPLDTDQNLSILPTKNIAASEYAFKVILLMENKLY